MERKKATFDVEIHLLPTHVDVACVQTIEPVKIMHMTHHIRLKLHHTFRQWSHQAVQRAGSPPPQPKSPADCPCLYDEIKKTQ